jgi:hypothetical protein
MTSPGFPDRTWRRAAAVLLVLLSAIVLATFSDYGLTWDEEAHRIYGELVLSWYSSGFSDRSAFEFRNAFLYGGLFDATAQLLTRVSPLGVYETRHLVNGAFGVLGIVATYRIGALIHGPRAGVLSAALLALTPAFYGHSFNNPKDIPFASLSALALFYIMKAGRELPRVRWSLVARTGVAIGAALGVRVGGAFLLGYAGVHWGARCVDACRHVERTEAAGIVALGLARLAAVFALAWATMLVFWPWAQVEPFARPLEALAAATRFGWEGTTLFDGASLSSGDLPWRYLPTWFAITLPEAYFVALACGAFWAGSAVIRRRPPDRVRLHEVGLLGLAVVFPIAAAIGLRSVLYDAHRHFLFVLPPLASVAGISLAQFTSSDHASRLARRAAAVAVAGSLALTVADMVRLHPYQTVFFNRAVAGGLRGASSRFETDYWGASYREGIEAVLRRYRPWGRAPVTIANCSEPSLTGHWLERSGTPAFVQVLSEDDPDLLLATTRWDCHRTQGNVLHVVEREGVPLLYVIERRQRGVWVDE